jgi:hypothetical protein
MDQHWSFNQEINGKDLEAVMSKSPPASRNFEIWILIKESGTLPMLVRLILVSLKGSTRTDRIWFLK